MFKLEGTPYLLDSAAGTEIRDVLSKVEERMSILRKQGTLTEATLKNYYGEKRYEQIAESNAIEGSTLSAGETQLAVLKGITVTGHDPAYVKDAIALDRALTRISEFAKDRSVATDIQQLQEVHSLILGDRPGAGIFRKDRVMISGSDHTPPKTWDEIMSAMEDWEAWSVDNIDLPAPIRSTVLHAWLTHIHPYADGNGRTSRAIGNLELIRAGYPPIIIKKKERDRYIQALAESDSGGDIRSFLELILDKIHQSLTGLELSAKQMQGYDPISTQIREMQESALRVWTTSVELLSSMVEHYLQTQLSAAGGKVNLKKFEDPVEFDEYIELCNGRAIPRSWAFILSVIIPGHPEFELLGYIGHRSAQMYQSFENVGGPSLYFSRRNPDGYPKWVSDSRSTHFMSEGTIETGNGDAWRVKLADDSLRDISTNRLATKISEAIIQSILAHVRA